MDGPTPRQVEDALRAVRAGDDAALLAFFKLLIRGKVLILVRRPGWWRGWWRARDEVLDVLMFGTEEGDTIPFFTSEERIAETYAENPGIARRYRVLEVEPRALFAMTSGQRLVLNPNWPYGKVFPPGVVDRLLEAADDSVTVIHTGEAPPLPPGAMSVLVKRLDTIPGVHAAHYGWVYFPPGPRQLIIMLVAEDVASVDAAFGGTLTHRLPDGRELEVWIKPPGEEHLLAGIPPFYVREQRA
ncbi:SseB family protein [Thermocatellispora tengchongensis]|uniref:SseB family protein n=1 Tax=Thermocatellispora tengchongensis TaxID=1073253 RepID=UPI001FE5B6C6|nr:SseB family protein [Thermocatellispora tengchongensis]